jgi:type III pantothenate kinase
MELVLDFGNTSRKAALFRNGEPVTLQQYPEITVGNLTELLGKNPGITSGILSSVIHHPKEIEELLASRFPTMILDPTTPLPILNSYKTPETLGKDRIAAAVAGAWKFPGEPVLVINAGTAITYDLIDPAAGYIGGAISPGMQMRFRALNTFTGKLPLIDYQETFPVPGSDTESSILSGVIHGITGEMEAFAKQFTERFPGLRIILSGGDLNYFAKRLKINTFAFANIVLYGLHQILLFNVNKTS